VEIVKDKQKIKAESIQESGLKDKPFSPINSLKAIDIAIEKTAKKMMKEYRKITNTKIEDVDGQDQQMIDLENWEKKWCGE